VNMLNAARQVVGSRESEINIDGGMTAVHVVDLQCTPADNTVLVAVARHLQLLTLYFPFHATPLHALRLCISSMDDDYSCPRFQCPMLLTLDIGNADKMSLYVNSSADHPLPRAGDAIDCQSLTGKICLF